MIGTQDLLLQMRAAAQICVNRDQQYLRAVNAGCDPVVRELTALRSVEAGSFLNDLVLHYLNCLRSQR